MLTIRDIYYKYLEKYIRFIPIIGIIILIYLNSQQANIKTSTPTSTTSIVQQLSNFVLEFTQSFDFSDTTKFITTIIILITIWTGYKYWLNNLKVIRRNSQLMERIVFVIMLFVFSNHIKLKSTLGQYFDYGLFLLGLYLILNVSWLIAKIIDSINLESDLYCWGLRLIGGGLVIFGAILFMSGSMINVLTNFSLTFNNIYWIAGLCIVALGIFCEFRSFRRYGVFVYMR